MNKFTKEQKEQWDKITGPGLYDVIGDGAYDYLCERIRNLLFDGADLHTFILIGAHEEKARFLKTMNDLAVDPDYFYYFEDREQANGDEYYLNLNSLDDTERFCKLIRQPEATGHHRIGAVVILNCGEETKHIDKLLKVPVLMNGATTFIQLPVFNQSDAEWSEFSKVNNNKTSSGVTRTIELIRADEIEVKAQEWLVPEFVPMYAPTVFSGEMDTRKSTLALDIAAKGSGLDPWFMQSEGEMEEFVLEKGWRKEVGTDNKVTMVPFDLPAGGAKYRIPMARKPFLTLFAGAEDDYARTVVPRYIAAGGAPDCFHCLKLDVRNEKQTADGLQVWETPLSLDEHIEELRKQIQYLNRTREWPVGLLICDPIISFFGNKNYNNPQDARDIMRQLKNLCEQEQISIINICHYNKTQGLTAKQKTAGSKALVEAHRMGWAFDLMEDDPKITLIAPIKKNLLKDARSYKLTTVDCDGVGVIKFVGYSNMTADERIEEKESKDRGNRKEIKKAILDALKDGPMPAGRVCNDLQDVGSLSSLKRAAASLLEEGKMRRSGTNPKNFVWELATESEQTPIFQGAASNE